MAHTRAMTDRLPLLYREGELVGAVLAQPGQQIEIVDEEALAVQKAHYFDSTLELEEAARLAALLDILPESWQTLGEFRAWVHSLRDAMLQQGAVTREALKEFVTRYTQRYQAVVRTQVVPGLSDQTWQDGPLEAAYKKGAALHENPLLRRYERMPAAGGVEPLSQFNVEMRGLDETYASFLLVGMPSAPESVPVVANLSSGQALYFLGQVPPGARLWIKARPNGTVEANLEGDDVSARMRSVQNVVPGAAWDNARVQNPARAITLKRGRNDLWFLPLAHFDMLGLDRFLLALADLLLQQGRFDQTGFDHALFYQDPAVIFRMTWLESQPAAFEVQLPGGALLTRTDPAGDAATRKLLEKGLRDRERLDFSLNQAIRKLKAAGVSGTVRLYPFTEVQGQFDRLATVIPLTRREIGPMGADRLPDAGGMFEITGFEQSTFR